MAVDKEAVLKALEKVIDPELRLNIVDLGLVYGLDVDENGKVDVTMTLTTPACPAGPQIVYETKEAAESVDGVTEANIHLVWEPRWTEDRMSERLKKMRAMGMWG